MNRLLLFAFLLVTLPSNSVHALMGPHIRQTNISAGGVLKTQTLVLKGYSLNMIDISGFQVNDLTDNRPVVVERKLKCGYEWRGPAPGGQQHPCELNIKLLNAIPGFKYIANFKNSNNEMSLVFEVKFWYKIIPKDSDGDGMPDDHDAFPYDPFESKDEDGDGIGDNADPEVQK